MIQANFPGQPLLSIRGTAALSALVAPGSAVRVEILGTAKGGGNLVRIAGQTFTASGVSRFAAGQTFTARIRFSSGTVYLHQLSSPGESAPGGALPRLDVGETRTASFLVSFFQKMNARLDERTINPLVRLASRFPLKEQRAAEAGAILSERGIEADFASVERMVRCIEGTTDASDRDFLSFVNHKKGQDRHWIVIPFSRTAGGQRLAGSVRFLVDTASSRHLETRITCFEGNRCWDFELGKDVCNFTADPAFKPVNFEKFVVYLRGILGKSGIEKVCSYLPGDAPDPLVQAVDLEI